MLGGVVFAIVFIVVVIKILVSAPDEPSGTAATAQTAAPNDPTERCPKDNLKVTLAVSQRSYPEGTKPEFISTVTNTSGSACVVDLGETAVQWLVTSGSDRIWSNTDCAPESASKELIIQPNKSEEIRAQWGRARSAKGCQTGLPEPRPGTYRVEVTVGGVKQGTVAFDLTEKS